MRYPLLPDYSDHTPKLLVEHVTNVHTLTFTIDDGGDISVVEALVVDDSEEELVHGG